MYPARIGTEKIVQRGLQRRSDLLCCREAGPLVPKLHVPPVDERYACTPRCGVLRESKLDSPERDPAGILCPARHRGSPPVKFPIGDDPSGILSKEPGGVKHGHRHTWVTDQLRKLFDAAGLPGVRLHDLRHTHASLLLLTGANPRVVQERLGHASVSITLDVYSHVLPGLQRDAANRVDDLLRAVANGLQAPAMTKAAQAT